MTTSLGKSYLFGYLCVIFMNVYQFVCLFLSLLVLRVGWRSVLTQVEKINKGYETLSLLQFFGIKSYFISYEMFLSEE